jgi:hypothetical protein
MLPAHLWAKKMPAQMRFQTASDKSRPDTLLLKIAITVAF